MKKFWQWIKYHYEWYMFKWTWGLTSEQVYYCQQRVKEVQESRYKKLLDNKGKYLGWELTMDNPLL